MKLSYLISYMFVFTYLLSCNMAFAQNEKKTKVESVEFYYFCKKSKDITAISAFAEKSFFSISTSNEFLLKELTNSSCFFSFFFSKNNSFNFEISHFGYKDYGLLKASMGYARKFGRYFSTGMRFYYFWNHVTSYEPLNYFVFDISFQFYMKNKFGFGVLIYNPAMLKTQINKGDIIPTSISLFFIKPVKNKLTINGIIEKLFPGDINASIGIEYLLNIWLLSEKISLSEIQLDVGFIWKKFNINLESKYSYRLGGYSPALHLYYYF